MSTLSLSPRQKTNIFSSFVDLHHLDADLDLDPDPVCPFDLCGSGILLFTYMCFRICKSGKLDTDPHLHRGDKCVLYPHFQK
jgi:hypothetical protein